MANVWLTMDMYNAWVAVVLVVASALDVICHEKTDFAHKICGTSLHTMNNNVFLKNLYFTEGMHVLHFKS